MKTWDLIKAALLMILEAKLPKWAFAMLKDLLENLSPDTPEGLIGDAPDALKAFVKETLLAAIATLKFPFVARVLTRIVNSLDGMILDFVWDYVMAQTKGLITSPAIPEGGEIALDDIVEAA